MTNNETISTLSTTTFLPEASFFQRPTTTTTAIPSTTPDVAAYIASHLGAQHLPLSTIVPISVVYTIIFILGVLGNVSTILVILKNKYMHTPTNVYLANLAISDLLTHLVAMPFELYLLWRQYPWVFGEIICDAKMVATETVTYSSILTIVAFTVERYLAICRPLAFPRRFSKMSRAVLALFSIWIASVSFSLPWLFFNKVNYLTNEYTNEVLEESAWCAVPWNEDSRTPLYLMIASTVVAFIIPFTLVTVLYYRIGCAMKKSVAMKRSAANLAGRDAEAEIAYNKGRQAVVRMLAAVVLVFFVCWTPFHAQRLMFVIVTLQGSWTKANGFAHHVLFLASGVGYYLSSCVNPLLYSMMSKRFRRGFRDMFKRNRSLTNMPGSAAAIAAAAVAGGVVANDPPSADGPSGPHGGLRGQFHRARRELARYPLQLAPQGEVMAPSVTAAQAKKSNGQRDSRSSSIFCTNDDLSCNEVRPEASESRGLLRPVVVYLNQADLHQNNGKTSAPYGAMVTSSPKAQLIVSWKRPGKDPSRNCERSTVQILALCGDTAFPNRTNNNLANLGVSEIHLAESIEMQELSGTRKKPSKKKPLKLPCPLIRHSSATDDIGAESYGFRDSSLSNTGVSNGKWLLNAKSEGDDPDCISHEISVMVAERLVKKTSLTLDIPTNVTQTKEKLKLRKKNNENPQL